MSQSKRLDYSLTHTIFTICETSQYSQPSVKKFYPLGVEGTTTTLSHSINLFRGTYCAARYRPIFSFLKAGSCF